MARQPQLRYSLFDGHVAKFSGKLCLVASALTKQRCSVLTVCSVWWAEASQRQETSVHVGSQMAETWQTAWLVRFGIEIFVVCLLRFA